MRLQGGATNHLRLFEVDLCSARLRGLAAAVPGGIQNMYAAVLPQSNRQRGPLLYVVDINCAKDPVKGRTEPVCEPLLLLHAVVSTVQAIAARCRRSHCCADSGLVDFTAAAAASPPHMAHRAS